MVVSLRGVATPEKEKSAGFWAMIGIFILRTADSGLAPWTLVALFLTGSLYLLTCHLDSKDSLSLLTRMGSFHGFVWAGWVFAFIEIPICRWHINRWKKHSVDRIEKLEAEVKAARDELKKRVAGNYRLES